MVTLDARSKKKKHHNSSSVELLTESLSLKTHIALNMALFKTKDY